MLGLVLSELVIPSAEKRMPTATAHSGAMLETDAAFLVGNKWRRIKS